MTGVQAIILAIVQGITELFPISSLGHAVLLPALLHWNVDENAEGRGDDCERWRLVPVSAGEYLGTGGLAQPERGVDRRSEL